MLFLYLWICLYRGFNLKGLFFKFLKQAYPFLLYGKFCIYHPGYLKLSLSLQIHLRVLFLSSPGDCWNITEGMCNFWLWSLVEVLNPIFVISSNNFLYVLIRFYFIEEIKTSPSSDLFYCCIFMNLRLNKSDLPLWSEPFILTLLIIV